MKKNMYSRIHPVFTLVLFAVVAAGCPLLNPTPNNNQQPCNGSTIECQTFHAVNDERTDESLTALVWDDNLAAVARTHSQDMIDRGFFSHTNPDGDDPFDRMGNAGITYTTAGENIAWNNFPDPVTTAVDGWMNSAGHRANILRTTFTHTGMGVADDGAGTYYFTQLFAAYSKDGEWLVYEAACPPPLAIER